jgi:hypothetical protein
VLELRREPAYRHQNRSDSSKYPFFLSGYCLFPFLIVRPFNRLVLRLSIAFLYVLHQKLQCTASCWSTHKSICNQSNVLLLIMNSVYPDFLCCIAILLRKKDDTLCFNFFICRGYYTAIFVLCQWNGLPFLYFYKLCIVPFENCVSFSISCTKMQKYLFANDFNRAGTTTFHRLLLLLLLYIYKQQFLSFF